MTSLHSCFRFIILFNVDCCSENVSIKRSILFSETFIFEGRILVCLCFLVSSLLEELNKRSINTCFLGGVQIVVRMLVVANTIFSLLTVLYHSVYNDIYHLFSIPCHVCRFSRI